MNSETAKKAKSKVKAPKSREIKRPIMIGGTMAILGVAGVIGGLYFFFISNKQPEKILNYSYYDLPDTLDPSGVSTDVDVYVLGTIAEGLFGYTSNENHDITYCLATSHEWSQDNMNLTCTIRQKVKFHDGTPLNASAVKWNFDRVQRLIDGPMLYPDPWYLPNGNQILNKTIIIDDYIVRFILNAPYVAFLSLLCSYPSFIVSPTSTPADRLLDVYSEPTIGTGAFKFDSYNINVSLVLKANPNYWGGKPKIDTLKIIQIEYFEDLLNALINGDVDGTRTRLAFFESEIMLLKNASIIVNQQPFANLRWIVMNNKKINVTMRKAISYAINYSIIKSIGKIRAISPIPASILYHNITGINAPYYNVSIARQILIDSNWQNTSGLAANSDINPGNEWEVIANSSFPLATYNFTYASDWAPNRDPYIIMEFLIENLKQIGVKLIPHEIPISQYWAQRYETSGYTRDMFDITWSGWGADFNDPCNFIDMIFTTKRLAENIGQVNDSQTQIWMEEASIEGNSTKRKEIYYQIQKRLIEKVFPIICSYSSIVSDVYNPKIKGWYFNLYKLPFNEIHF